MKRFERSWTGCAAAAAMTVGLALATSAAMAAPAVEQVDGVNAPSAASLLRFYPSALPSSPPGAVEDQQVWLAKVQGLMAGAPSLLQQSLLMSQSKQEFSSNVMLLHQLQKTAFEQNAINLRSLAKSGTLGTKAVDVNSPLGSGNGDLVYTALEPCRIMDTRSASGASGVQGPIVGGSLKSIPGFITTGTDWSAYGQTAPLSDCGLNSSIGGNIWAVAIVITIPSEGGRPDFDAFLGVSDTNNLNTTLSHVALNFTHQQGISTMYIVPQLSNTIYFAMPAGLHANIIFDVVGFFAVSEATALDCVFTAAGTVVVAAGGTGTAMSPACASGYTLTGGQCQGQFYQALLAAARSSGGNSWWCDYTNQTGGNQTFSANARCCRVPGR